MTGIHRAELPARIRKLIDTIGLPYTVKALANNPIDCSDLSLAKGRHRKRSFHSDCCETSGSDRPPTFQALRRAISASYSNMLPVSVRFTTKRSSNSKPLFSNRRSDSV